MKLTWKRLIVAGSIVLLLSAGVLWALEVSETRSERKSVFRMTDEEKSLLSEGDIIMRKGFGMVSRMIASNLNEKREISHCGIIVKTDEGWGVIHTVSASLSEVDGMQLHSLDEFVRQSKPGSIVVSRLKECENRSRIGEEAYRYLDSAITFDHSFDLADSSRFYCSELIWHVLSNAAGVDIYDGNFEGVGYYSFEKLLAPDKFELVIDQFNP